MQCVCAANVRTIVAATGIGAANLWFGSEKIVHWAASVLPKENLANKSFNFNEIRIYMLQK